MRRRLMMISPGTGSAVRSDLGAPDPPYLLVRRRAELAGRESWRGENGDIWGKNR